jgi:RNA polymerase sigma-70 factor (ECF subfamily)
MSPLNEQHHEQFLRLFAEHEPALRTFTRLLVTPRDDVSVVMQEVAVTLWQKFGEFDATRDFRKWAFGVVRYTVLAHLRDRARDRHVFDDELVNRLAEDAVAMNQRHEAQREALEVCLQKLPAAQRETVLAAYTKGTRMDELAAQRGQTAMSLYKMLHRIRQALLECVRRTVSQEELA